MENKLKEEKSNNFYVVGIGASAGGYEALETFFRNMPPDNGMAFVVIQHLSPDFKSLMAELLSKHTKMRVYRVEDGMQVEPNCVYLIPPKKSMTIFHSHLYLSEISHSQGLNLPINIFFRSLAEDKQDRAIGIILSGTGSDGTLGIRDIKGSGGMVMVQDIATSKFDGMPRSAISIGMVDFILAPEKMPEELIRFVEHIHTTRDETTLTNHHTGSSLPKILSLIKNSENIDFSYYKPTTIIRRIEKRMGINQIATIQEYISFMETHQEEVRTLSRELLIGVTKFFRDTEAFNEVKNSLIPKLVANRKANTPIQAVPQPNRSGVKGMRIDIKGQ
jgi:two-component system CheB/CheR fusion protein